MSFDAADVEPGGSTSSITNRTYETNSWSIMSKYSAVKQGYFNDQYLVEYVESRKGKQANSTCRRSPLVNRGYAARMMAVDWIVKRHLSSGECLIILGAGHDMLSLRHISENCNQHFVEIDLPEVIRDKYEFIKSRVDSENHPETIDGEGYTIMRIPKFKLHLVACDIRNQSDLSRALEAVQGNIPPGDRQRLAVLNEVCLCYLEPLEVKQTLATLIEVLEKSANTHTLTYIGFEQVRPQETSPFGRVMLEHFNSLGFPLRYFPTKSQLNDLFKQHLNFQHLAITPMYQVYHNAMFTMRMANMLNIEEPFDEYEEMDLYLSHYALVSGAINITMLPYNSLDGFDPGEHISGGASGDTDELCAKMDSQLMIGKQVSCESNEWIKRYGHASCCWEEAPGSHQSILVTGGFGISHNRAYDPTISKHQRLGDWFFMHRIAQNRDWAFEDLTLLGFPPSSEVPLARMHGQICRGKNSILLVHGGREAPVGGRYYNNYFFARVEGNKLCYLDGCAGVGVWWRHQALTFQDGEKFLHVGGLTDPPASPTQSNIGIIHLERHNDIEYCNLAPEDADLFARHSFGMDFQSASTFLVFGGLQSKENLGRPVQFGQGVVLLDLRNRNKPTKLDFLAPYYDSQVHFISDFQFVNIGGVSTMTGEPNTCVELYDFRMSNQSEPVTRKPLQPLLDDGGDPRRRMIPTKQTSIHLKTTREIVTLGGGGNYFTFGTHYNRNHLVYNYSELL